jgi:hypothetical protein
LPLRKSQNLEPCLEPGNSQDKWEINGTILRRRIVFQGVREERRRDWGK